ncbi:HNH endonuclease signature motif containing protein [Frankia sp. EI5c]|uniref:HNH endonuclease signature motif containing protein n=1 Tax=Frankia sp. EI5c TaxID=683316 RepID=UPI001F5B36C9|nr:HNH endonuclease signature motif containing protein [Frankia sp. EI5c]
MSTAQNPGGESPDASAERTTDAGADASVPDGDVSARMEGTSAALTPIMMLLGGVRSAVAMVSRSNALLLRLLAQLSDLYPAAVQDPAGILHTDAPELVAAALGVSTQSATGQLIFAQTVAGRLPNALDALEAGALDLPRLESLANAIRPLDDQVAEQVEAQVLAGGPRAHRASFTSACRRAVHNLDPDGAGTRAKRRRHDRHVRLAADNDGVSRLTALLPTDEAAACYQRIDQVAGTIASRRPEGDDRSRDEIRADVLVDLVLGRAEHASPVPVEVQVVVPVGTLLGLSTEPGEIPGAGPVPAQIAREMGARQGSTWRRLLTDPNGHLVEIADRRFPTAAQQRHVRARNRTCVFPHCARPSRRADIDHTVPYAHGGATITSNLGPMCTRHHRVRHRQGWSVVQPQAGVFVWTSPTGTVFIVEPHSYRDHENVTTEMPSAASRPP